MFDEDSVLLYVGKAQNLKKRLASYFQKNITSVKVRSLMQQVERIEVTVTSPTEALLLENNLIKRYKPKYNILLRDDKSYPYIFLSTQHKFPRLTYYRGKRQKNMKGKYFGPYPSAVDVRQTLNFLQRLFRIRQCSNTFFKNRTRPCLQYQIKRCTAPCVNYINEADYMRDVEHAELFLKGKNQQIIDELVQRMELAIKDLAYEQAAYYRDQIASLRKIQEQQYVSDKGGNADVLAVAKKHNIACVQVVSIRDGSIIANKPFIFNLMLVTESADIFAEFLPRYYLEHCEDIPTEIIIECEIPQPNLLEELLKQQTGRSVRITWKVRDKRAKWRELAQVNAQQTLASHLLSTSRTHQQLDLLQKLLKLPCLPRRIECFDISHTQGEATTASCVVFQDGVPLKSAYRRFNITHITRGDDYAAMYQALMRRYTKLKISDKTLPDVLLIDGGKGQLRQAEKVLEELQIPDITVVGVAKGRSRKPGLETLIKAGEPQEVVACPADSHALHLIQYIRDEAHRFAIAGHRQKRGKNRRVSSLEQISGIGAQRRQKLLSYFGGLQELKQASIDELARVPGISKTLAKQIYDFLHELQ